MKIVVADDDPIAVRRIEAALESWGHNPVVVHDGSRALAILRECDAPTLAILDWEMPGCDGVEICRQLGHLRRERSLHTILVTAKGRMEDLVRGLGAGANDYLRKPFDVGELKARVDVGLRTLDLEDALRHRLEDLEAALAQVKVLSGLLPICSYCKRVRDDRNYWHQVEKYVGDHSEARFSHGVCPECYERVVSSLKEEPR